MQIAPQDKGVLLPLSAERPGAMPLIPQFEHSSRCRILSVGADPVLLGTRQLLLAHTGACLYSAGFDAAALMAATDCFDILLLCHTLRASEVICLCALAARLHPGCRFILIDNLVGAFARGSSRQHAFAWSHGPKALVAHIVSMATQPAFA